MLWVLWQHFVFFFLFYEEGEETSLHIGLQWTNSEYSKFLMCRLAVFCQWVMALMTFMKLHFFPWYKDEEGNHLPIWFQYNSLWVLMVWVGWQYFSHGTSSFRIFKKLHLAFFSMERKGVRYLFDFNEQFLGILGASYLTIFLFTSHDF